MRAPAAAASSTRRRVLDEAPHPRHVVARVTVGHERRDRRLREEQRRGAGPVASRVERAAGGVGVEGARVEIPEIEADEAAVLAAGEPGTDLRQQVVHPGVHERHPDHAALDPAGHRGVQGLGARHPFEVASQVLDRARHPVFVVREPPAGGDPAVAAGHREEHRARSGAVRLGVAHHHPAQGPAGLDAIDPQARAVGEHERAADADRVAAAGAQRLARELHRPARRERAGPGFAGIVRRAGAAGIAPVTGAAQRGQRGVHPLPGRRRPGIPRRRTREVGDAGEADEDGEGGERRHRAPSTRASFHRSGPKRRDPASRNHRASCRPSSGRPSGTGSVVEAAPARAEEVPDPKGNAPRSFR